VTHPGCGRAIQTGRNESTKQTKHLTAVPYTRLGPLGPPPTPAIDQMRDCLAAHLYYEGAYGENHTLPALADGGISRYGKD
jgi:hypothetical protein